MTERIGPTRELLFPGDLRRIGGSCSSLWIRVKLPAEFVLPEDIACIRTRVFPTGTPEICLSQSRWAAA